MKRLKSFPRERSLSKWTHFRSLIHIDNSVSVFEIMSKGTARRTFSFLASESVLSTELPSPLLLVSRHIHRQSVHRHVCTHIFRFTFFLSSTITHTPSYSQSTPTPVFVRSPASTSTSPQLIQTQQGQQKKTQEVETDQVESKQSLRWKTWPSRTNLTHHWFDKGVQRRWRATSLNR